MFCVSNRPCAIALLLPIAAGGGQQSAKRIKTKKAAVVTYGQWLAVI
jgi:hypothetical protein